MNKILWNSIKSPRFLVPAGEDVFAGEYQIENGDGEEASVDLESILPFEINEKEAEDIMMNELENTTAELGGLFKDLFKLGKRMINSDQLDDDSEDWDSEDSDDSDDSDDSEWDSDDSDFDEADLDKVLSLLDADSEDDSESASEFDAGSIEDIISQFGSDLEGPLTELRDLIVQEVGNLGEELDKLGSEAAKELDTEPGAGQDILRELGQWLINLGWTSRRNGRGVVVMDLSPKIRPKKVEEKTRGYQPRYSEEDSFLKTPQNQSPHRKNRQKFNLHQVKKRTTVDPEKKPIHLKHWSDLPWITCCPLETHDQSFS